MKNKIINLALCVFPLIGIKAQITNSFLELNNAKALLNDGGVLFTNHASGNAAYEIPKGSGRNAIYATSFWFAGIDQNGILRNSSPKYTSLSDIFKGPYSSTDSYQNSAYQSKYLSSIWTVSKYEIDYHIQNYLVPSYVVPASIANWPGNGDLTLGVAENLAPFIDVDGDNIYNPTTGDHPDIRGDQATYIIMNDASAVHTETDGESMGIEVHLMVYQFASFDYLDSTTFINMRVFNRGQFTYNNFKVALYVDADLGNYTDDYFGSMSSKDLVYTYNADNFDADVSGALGYGINPPCLGVTSLKSNFHSAGFYSTTQSFPYNDPNTATEIWNVMNAKWNDGSSWTSNFQMDGNPYTGTGTTEVGLSNPSGDRRMVMNFDSVVMMPGQSLCEDFAILYKRGTDNLHSVQTVIELADSVKTFFDNQLNFNCNQVTLGISEKKESNFTIFPNPAKGKFTIEIPLEAGEQRVQLNDLSGRLIYDNLHLGTFELNTNEKMLPGIYIVTIGDKTNHFKSVRLVVN